MGIDVGICRDDIGKSRGLCRDLICRSLQGLGTGPDAQ